MNALRYLIGIVLATFVSFAVFYIGIFGFSHLIDEFPTTFNNLKGIFPSLLFILVGFFGVFIGSLCLHRETRYIGSVILTALGVSVATSIWFLSMSITSVNRMNVQPLLWMDVSLAIGGIFNILRYRFARVAEQDAAANP